MKFIRLGEVLNRTSLSRSCIYEKIAEGEFPAAINLTPRSVGWIESEIEEWMETKVRSSRGGSIGGIKTSDSQKIQSCQ